MAQTSSSHPLNIIDGEEEYEVEEVLEAKT